MYRLLNHVIAPFAASMAVGVFVWMKSLGYSDEEAVGIASIAVFVFGAAEFIVLLPAVKDASSFHHDMVTLNTFSILVIAITAALTAVGIAVSIYTMMAITLCMVGYSLYAETSGLLDIAGYRWMLPKFVIGLGMAAAILCYRVGRIEWTVTSMAVSYLVHAVWAELQWRNNLYYYVTATRLKRV